MRAPVLALTFASAAGGCVGGPRGAAEVGRAGREVRAAEEAGAREEPRASYFLELAEHELRRARGQLDAGDVGARGAWAARAEADAEVAAMTAIEAATRGAAQRTEAEAEALARGLRGRGER